MRRSPIFRPANTIPWALVGLVGIGAFIYIATHAASSVTDLVVALLMGSVIATITGGVIAIGWARRELRSDEDRREGLGPPIALLMIGWAGIVLAIFGLLLLAAVSTDLPDMLGS